MENIEKRIIKVYIKLNKNNEITQITSSSFLKDESGWIKLYEGLDKDYIDKYGKNIVKPLMNPNGTYNYLYIDGKIVEN